MASDVARPDEGFIDYTASLPTKRIAAAVLFFDVEGHLLLVEPTYQKNHWELPGGTVEANESPRAAAIREIREELGLTITPGRLLVVDWVPPQPTRTEGLMIVFDGGVLTSERAAGIRTQPDELRRWAWSTPAQEVSRLSPLLARRAAAGRRARTAGGTAYLEDGQMINA
jgi:8-oxo-dGTP pyrophosphatase MutT (NUDIX family)